MHARRLSYGMGVGLGPSRLRWALMGALLATSMTSGCLRDEVFPEPYAWRAGDTVTGQGDRVADVRVPDTAQRLRFTYEATVSSLPLVGNPQGVHLVLRDAEGRLHQYNLTTTGRTQDLFGGDVGGTWRVAHSDPAGDSRFTVRFEHYQPRYDDWAWWQVWRS